MNRSADEQRSVIAIGDVQGCAGALHRLLATIPDEARAEIWFCGDLVNRGPNSLDALRTVCNLGDRAVCVLGNHDLHLLAAAAGVRRISSNDTIDDILSAPDRDILLDWLRHRPLAHWAHAHLLVHAGVLPSWSVEQTLDLAQELHEALCSTNHAEVLAALYAPGPTRWRDSLTGMDRLRCALNALTRVRYCTAEGDMDLTNTGYADVGQTLVPWFDLPRRRTRNVSIVFGHWSALGLKLAPNLIGIDTGCVWGQRLTAVELAVDPQTRRVWQVECSDCRRTPDVQV